MKAYPAFKFYALFLLTMMFISLQAQIYNYTSAITGTYSYLSANATATNLAVVNGAMSVSSCPDGFNGAKFSTPAGFNLSRTAIEFSVTPNTHFQLNCTTLSFQCRRDIKGPQKFRLAYSTNGGSTWSTNGSDYLLSADAGCGVMTTFSWNLPDFSSATSVIFRIYAFNSTLASGVVQIKNIKLNGSVSYTDGDGDGYIYGVDCNDADFTINPGVTEICNTLDDDCDGSTDEGLPVNIYYADSDLDGFGNNSVTISSCGTAPSGFISDNTDCNDLDGSINPAATEICNALDDNCVSGIDEGLSTSDFYADADHDGFGDNFSVITTCGSAPAGYITDNADCNDLDNMINPGTPEICNAMDDNCDGNSDEGFPLNTFYSDGDNDGYGVTEITLLSCAAALSGYSLLDGDCDDTNAAINYDGNEVINGIDDDCDGEVDYVIITIPAEITGGRIAGPGLSGINFTTAPNPASDHIDITFETPVADENITVAVFNTIGQMVYEQAWQSDNGIFNCTIHLDNTYQNGMYILQIMTSGGAYFERKVMINK